MTFEMLWLPSLLFVMLCLLSVLLLFLLRQWQKSQAENKEVTLSILEMNRNLMDRLMSKDLQTYATMTALTTSSQASNDSSDYETRSDIDEIRMAHLAQGAGLGQVLFDDQTDLSDLQDLINGGGANALMGMMGGNDKS